MMCLLFEFFLSTDIDNIRAQEDFVRRWEMCFREYPDILTEPKNNEKLLIFIDRASRYLQTVKDRLNNDGNQNSQTV